MRRHRIALLAATTVVALLAGFAAGTSWLGPGVKPPPRQPLGADPVGHEVGVAFTVTAARPAAGVRFHQSDDVSRYYTVSLWGGDGALLAQGSATLAGPGWQQVAFTKAVRLAPGKQYRMSLWAPVGPRLLDGDPKHAAHRAPWLRAVGAFFHRGPGYPARPASAGDYPIDLVVELPAAVVEQAPSSTKPSSKASPSSSGSSRPGSSGSSQGSGSEQSGSSGRTVVAGGCAADPSACGYPDSGNSGAATSALRTVPGQVSRGSGWSYDSRGFIRVSGNGAVLENLDLNGTIEVAADDVTIKNVRLRGRFDDIGIALRNSKNVTIQDCTIAGPSSAADRMLVGIKDIYGDATGTKVIGCDISGTSTGIQIFSGLIQANYIHDMGYRDGDHVNGTTSNGGTTPLTIRGNTIFNEYDQTDAISLFQDFGVEANRVIDDNLLAGGGYTIYAGANPGGAQTSGIKVTNNRISRMYYPKGGYYGPATAYDKNGPGNVWSGNVWDDTGAAISAP